MHPDAIDVNDLACTQFETSRLTAPKTTKSPFCPAPAPPALILSLYYQNPGCADGRRPELVSLPLTLDYIRWDIKDQKFLYRLDKRPDGRMRASALISAYCRRRCLDERECSGSLDLKNHLETSRSHPSTASCHQFSPPSISKLEINQFPSSLSPRTPCYLHQYHASFTPKRASVHSREYIRWCDRCA